MSRLRGLWPVWLSACLAVVVFSAAVGAYDRPPVLSDALGYTWSAKTISTLHVYNNAYAESPKPDARVMPGYPVFLSAFYALAPRDADFERTVRAIHPWVLMAQLLLAVTTVALVAACGIELGGMLLGAIAGLLAAFYLPLAWSSSVALTETLAAFLVSLQLLLATRMLHPRRTSSRRIFLSLGLVTGMLAVVRPIYLPWVLVPTLLFAAQRQVGPKELAVRVALSLTGVLLLLTPWWARNAIDFRRFIPLTEQSDAWGIGTQRLAATGGGAMSPEEQAVHDQAIASGRDGNSVVADLRVRRAVAANPAGYVVDRLRSTWTVVTRPHIAPFDAVVTQRDSASMPSVANGIAFAPVPEDLRPAFKTAMRLSLGYQLVLVLLAIAGTLFVWRRPRVILVASLVVYATLAYSSILLLPRYFFPTMPAVILLAATAVAGTISLVRKRLPQVTEPALLHG